MEYAHNHVFVWEKWAIHLSTPLGDISPCTAAVIVANEVQLATVDKD